VTILAAEDTLDTVYLRSSSRQTEKMRRITSTVQSRLPEVVRRNPRPEPDPMMSQDIWTHEEEIDEDIFVETSISDSMIIDLEPERTKATSKKTDQVAERLYLKLLEAGQEGATPDQLEKNLKTEKVDSTLVQPALKKLEKEKAVTKTNTGRYVSFTALKDSGETHTVSVEKVHRGFAEVLVDDTINALLYSEEYDGPRNILKKGSRFKAVVELYEEGRTIFIWVKEVTQIIEPHTIKEGHH
jgi:Fanconi anemia group M protein